MNYTLVVQHLIYYTTTCLYKTNFYNTSVGQIFIFGLNTNIFGFPNFTEYENIWVSKYHRIQIRIYSGFKISLNTNTNIFGCQNFTEYKYEYIRVSKFHRIRIQIYSGFKISPNRNICRFQNFTKYEY